MSIAKLSLLLGCIALMVNGCGSTGVNSSLLPSTSSSQSSGAEPEAEIVAAFEAAPEPAALALDAYLDLHRTLINPRSLSWPAAVKSLAQQGDLFTIHLAQELRTAVLSQEQANTLREMESSIRSTHVSDELSPKKLTRLLETAAYADVTCHFIEQDLTRWTHTHVSAFCNDTKVRAELQRLAQDYRSDFSNVLLRRSVESRVQEYAQKLLVDASRQE